MRVRPDDLLKARIAELEEALWETVRALHAAEVQLGWSQSDMLGNAQKVLEKP